MNNNSHTGKLLTIAEVMDWISVSRSTVYQLLNSGSLQSVKIGSSRRIPESALKSFMQSLENQK